VFSCPEREKLVPLVSVEKMHRRRELAFSSLKKLLEGIVHQKMKILSLFTHPYVVPNLFEILSSIEHKIRYFEECWKPVDSSHCLP